MRCLPSGQVVVALAGGAVDVLTPEGDSLSVAADLRPQGGVPEASSALQIIQTSGGQLEALVSSQGSSTVFVFALTVAVTGIGGGSGADTGSTGQSASGRPGSTSVSTTTDTSLIQTLGFNGSTSLSSTSLAAAPTATAGVVSISATGSVPGAAPSGFVGQFASLNDSNGTAVLVPIQGNSYSTVAVLNFAAASDDDSGSGGRQPELSMRYAIGDTSGLGKFVMGLDDAVKCYRSQEEERLQQEPDPPGNDPWMEDLFQHSTPLRLPVPNGKEDNEPMDDGTSRGALPLQKEAFRRVRTSSGVRQRDSYFAEALLDSSAGMDTIALAGLLAGLMIPPMMSRRDERESCATDSE